MSMQDESMVREILMKLTAIETSIKDISLIKDTLKKLEEATNMNNRELEGLKIQVDNLKLRVDKLDKIVWWVGTSIIGTMLTAIIGSVLILSGGVG